MVTITDKAKQTIEVQMQAGYITTEYVGDEGDFINKKGGYTYIHALDADENSIGSKTASPGTIAVAKPGRYRIRPHSYTQEAKDTPEFILKAGETHDIVIPRKWFKGITMRIALLLTVWLNQKISPSRRAVSAVLHKERRLSGARPA